VDPRKENLPDVVARELPEGAVVVEAVGPLLPLAIELVGGPRQGHAVGTTRRWSRPSRGHPAEKEVVIYEGVHRAAQLGRAATIMESGILPLDRIVSHRLPMRAVHEGLDLLRKGAAIRSS